MMLVNKTPHVVDIVVEGKLISLSPSGEPARVEVNQVQIGEVDGVPIVRTTAGRIKGLKSVCENCRRDCKKEGIEECIDQEPLEIYIVSSMIAMLCRRKDIVSPDTGPTALRDTEGNIIAVKRLQVFGDG